MNIGKFLGTENDKFVVIDIETTGFGDKAKIVEIAAVKFDNEELCGVFDSLINPEIHIPYPATLVHGIRDLDVSNSPTIEEILPFYCNFIGEFPLVGHNIGFDLSFLTRYECATYLKEKKIFDTLKISKKYVDAPNHKLETLINMFNIEVDKRHRAKDDSIATGKLFIKLMEEYG